jgi:Acetyltransferases, including N-acetylases of ribosomal proteins
VLLTDPVVLENAFVRLEPLTHDHADDLERAREGLDYAWYAAVPASMPDEIDRRIGERDASRMNPFAVVVDGRAVGMTTYYGIDLVNTRVEIGYTWLAPAVQRTAVNTASKLLLLAHAFEQCDVIAVQFCTHWHNRSSRAAIERLGAKQDGVLRNHRYGPDGSLRDTVVYSILPHEWPAVKRGLEARLERG